MKRFEAVLLTALGVSLFSTQAEAQRPETALPDPETGYQWKDAAKGHKLQPEAVRQLARDKILVTNEAFKQIFTPYIETDLPLFVTSDSLLGGFHVLFEESVLRLERANARKLPEILRVIRANLETVDKDLKGKPELVAAAKTRATVVIGTALRLLGDDSALPDAKIAKLIDGEAGRVTAATGQAKPAWLGPPDPGFVALDYSRYRPRGFYTRSQDLQRYFRAVSWLQSIPFRVEKDEELLSMLMLGNAVTYSRFEGDYEKQRELAGFFACYRKFIGAGDDWDLMTAAHEAQNQLALDLDEGGLARKRGGLLRRAAGYGKGPQINDQLAFAPDDPTKAAEVAFRVISPYRTPDAVLFQRTTDLRKFRRPFPEGLEVCAALGSALARSKLSGDQREELLKTIDRCKALFAGSSLYAEYLDCLRALLDAPEPDAPEFLSGGPWQVKSCQTVLAGWAQMRHTWALQAKPTAHYLGETLKPAGFVEPEPEFFSRMAALVRRTEETLKRAGAFDTDARGAAAEIRAIVDLFRRKEVARKGPQEALRQMTPEELNLAQKGFELFMALGVTPGGRDPAQAFNEGLEKLKALAARLEKGQMPEDRELAGALREMSVDLEPRWRDLGRLCRRLEALAHKQLRKVPPSDEENHFLTGYGEALAGVMLYGGNAYLTPKDDAPRIADVYSNPSAGKYLEVGVARPRALYVLYPHKGGEVLCRGAVMPYYEFPHQQRLTDAEWKALLDSKQRPPIPAWIKPVVAAGGIGIPERAGQP